jgi:hypothetical protein
MSLKTSQILAMLALAGACSVSTAGVTPRIRAPFEPEFRNVATNFDSGRFSNFAPHEAIVFQRVFSAPTAAWTRLLFDPQGTNLGKASYVRITSLRDFDVQHLNPEMMHEWNYATGFFNGGSVLVEIIAAPGDEDLSLSVAWQEAGEERDDNIFVDPVASICGADDRVASTEDRVARYNMGGCSHWFVNTGATLTAGHCTDFDPDDGGPGLPDGIIDFSGVVQINPPASNANGTTNAAPLTAQYPIQPATARFRFDGEGQGIGKDHCVYNLGRNSENNDVAHDTRGWYRMTDDIPATGTQTIRITGFGLDNTPPGSTGNRNSENFTNQTDTDPYQGSGSSGANRWHLYSTDTEGGNSGSPILWTNTNFTIGIHTNGGCNNSGTGFSFQELIDDLRLNVAPNTRFVDHSGRSNLGIGLGSAVDPYVNLSLAVAAVPNNGTIALTEGNYTQAAGGNAIANIGSGNSAMTIRALTGPVTIGN